MAATINAETRQPLDIPPAPGFRGWGWIIFVVVLIAELIAAYILVYQRNYIFNDAASRTANAYYVLFIEPPKLASIGFVWNPLPSLLQLPFLWLFNNIWRPMATSGIAGCVVTAIFAAGNASLLFRYFRQSGSGIAFSLIIIALYAFNPFIFLYGCNGMSETIFFTALIVGTYNFAMWMDDRINGRLLAVALVLAMSFLTRYEALTWILGLGVSLMVIVYRIEDIRSPFNPKPLRMQVDYLIGTGSVLFVPVVYTILIWMFLSLTIMGDPFFFLGSAYSNEAQRTSYDYIVDNAGRYVELLGYSLTLSLPFLPPAIVLLGERLATKRLLKWDMLVYVLLAGCFVGFHYTLLLKGRSFGWLRFFSYVLPLTLAWFPYELRKLSKKARKLTSFALVIVLALASPPLLLHYFQHKSLSFEEYEAFHGNPYLNKQVEMAQIINEKYSDATILFDSFTTSMLILNLDHPENVITTTSDDFDKAVKNPMGYNVDYILASVDAGVGMMDAVNRQYPGLFDHGTPWTELVEDMTMEGAGFGNNKDHDSVLRLYKVIPW